jgi:hypothetical protein
MTSLQATDVSQTQILLTFAHVWTGHHDFSHGDLVLIPRHGECQAPLRLTAEASIDASKYCERTKWAPDASKLLSGEKATEATQAESPLSGSRVCPKYPDVLDNDDCSSNLTIICS